MFAKSRRFGLFVLVAVSLSLACSITIALAQAAIIYSQPPSPNGGLYPSSWWDPDGSSADQYVWDNFTLGSTTTIAEIDWMGGYDPAAGGSGGPVLDFSVAIYASIEGGSQPDIHNPLVQYRTGGNADETLAGTYGGTAMYNYQYVLPTHFLATAATPYWVQIYAFQHGSPNWGLTHGTGGDGWHFRQRWLGIYPRYEIIQGDATFSLQGEGGAWIYLPLIQE